MQPHQLLAVGILCVTCLATLTKAGVAGNSRVEEEDDDLYTLPEGFLFGTGTSSYQVEGAWDQDGKGVNVYDAAVHVSDVANADVAADHYHRYEEDIDLLAKMKFDIYRFSISWARIFPNGYRSKIEKRGVDHYHKVIDKLLEHNIKPMITMSHFDIPQALLEEFPGWLSEKMVDVFVDFADFLFSEYGDKVEYWVPLNEPNMHCKLIRVDGSPGGPGIPVIEGLNNVQSASREYYKCVHHETLAHAKVYRLYKDKYYNKQKGLVGAGTVAFFVRPNSTEYDDIAAAERSNMFDMGHMLHPLVFGEYPPVMRTVLDAIDPSFLPTFTAEQKKLVQGAMDFLSVNSYEGFTVIDSAKSNAPVEATLGSPLGPAIQAPGTNVTLMLSDGITPIEDPGGLIREITSNWVLADLSLWIKANYGNEVAIFITENGAMDGVESIHDRDIKLPYTSAFLRNLVRATHLYNLNVIGYTYWSFLDGFEWLGACDSHRGIVKVDFKSKNLTRSLRDSWTFFEEISRTRKIPLVKSGSSWIHGTSSAILLCILSTVLSRL